MSTPHDRRPDGVPTPGVPTADADAAHVFAPHPSPWTGAWSPTAAGAAHGHGGAWGAYGQAGGQGGTGAPGPRRGRLALGIVGVLAVALLGGLVGGAISDDGGGGLLELEPRTAPPLEADNASVAAVADELLPSTVQILAQGSSRGVATGSGFVLDRRGHVITNSHVVAGAVRGGTIEVIDSSGGRYDAEVVGRSPTYDIAVLLVRDLPRPRPAALGASGQMRVGETVVAIGSPLGLGSTVTSGIVSALDRPVTAGDADSSSYINAVQTDAAINPGNSGGPLVNLQGQVVGVNSAIATTGGFDGSAGSIGVGFAIPIEQVQVTADQILRTGEARYPVIGANVSVGGGRASVGEGARIEEVPGDGPAAAAGLRPGDVVVAVDDARVTDGIGLIVAIRAKQPGQDIELTVRRDGQEVELTVTLGSQVG